MSSDDLAARQGYEAHDFHQFPDLRQWVDAGLVCTACLANPPDVVAVKVQGRVLEFWCRSCWDREAAS